MGVDCADDGNECTDDECSGGACAHPPLPDGTACADDGNECTLDECVGGSCTHPDKVDCSGCSDDWCIGGSCIPEICSIDVTTNEACPGATADLELTGSCDPGCWTMAVRVSQPPNATVSVLGGSIPCDGAHRGRTSGTAQAYNLLGPRLSQG